MKRFFYNLVYGGSVFFDLTRWVIVAGVILLLVNTFWFSVFIVDGLSMEPKLHNHEVALLEKSSYARTGTPLRGDVVVVSYPGDPNHKHYVKRVIGLPGEKLSIVSGKVYINDQVLNESYISYDVLTEPDGSWQIQSGSYFLMGDNRPNSSDSRYFGPVEKRFFIGKVRLVLFPRFISTRDF